MQSPTDILSNQSTASLWKSMTELHEVYVFLLQLNQAVFVEWKLEKIEFLINCIRDKVR